MRKIGYIVLISTMIFIISACGNNNQEEPSTDISTIESGQTTSNTYMDDLIEEETKEDIVEGVEEVESLELEDDEPADNGEILVEDNSTGTVGIVIEEQVGDVENLADGIDVDLTQLSATMVYAEVYNIMVNPDDYIGKTIKMTGIAYDYSDPNTGLTYYYCVITDATACCVQGIEFVLSEGYSEYPVADSQITVVGEFETYYEYDILYCRLKDAELLE